MATKTRTLIITLTTATTTRIKPMISTTINSKTSMEIIIIQMTHSKLTKIKIRVSNKIMITIIRMIITRIRTNRITIKASITMIKATIIIIMTTTVAIRITKTTTTTIIMAVMTMNLISLEQLKQQPAQLRILTTIIISNNKIGTVRSISSTISSRKTVATMLIGILRPARTLQHLITLIHSMFSIENLLSKSNKWPNRWAQLPSKLSKIIHSSPNKHGKKLKRTLRWLSKLGMLLCNSQIQPKR